VLTRLSGDLGGVGFRSVIEDIVPHNSPRRTMLVTGATGFIGSRLSALALARGFVVKTLTRSDWDSVPAVPIAQRYFGSLPEQIPLAALQGVDLVVHCAANFEATDQVARAVNVEGTVRLAHLSRDAGVQNFIFLSSQSARADAISAYGTSKYAAEQALLDIDHMNVIILRPGLVTGTGSRGLFRRLTRMVESLPIIPLLSGNSIVQPIHVDDLCEAIFRCDQAAPTAQGYVLNLGHPDGICLADFLQMIAVTRVGRRRVMLPIPLWPVETAVRITEALGIRLPINSGNIKGLKIVERMETAADLARLSLSLRTLDEMVRDDAVTTVHTIPLGERPVRVLLIGAGRIGLVHAITLSRLPGVTLCGVVDPNRKAAGFLRGLGLSMPAFQELDEAIAQTNPDAAVIGTPPSTHLSLARVCLQRRMAVLVEKPLAVKFDQLADYEQLAREMHPTLLQVGYVMLRCPQVTTLIDKLQSGSLGKVIGFLGITLLSFIQKAHPNRWEVTKIKSGGGAFINSGGHVLSMIYAAFGEPLSIEPQSVKLYSTEVEDSMVVRFVYPTFEGRHYCTWSIDGCPRQENKLVIWTDQGHLILTGSVGVFVSNAGNVDVTHQLDFDVKFNLAPDYAGAGFSNELNDLKEAVLTGQPAPMNLSAAIKLERLLFKTYDSSRELKSFEGISDGHFGELCAPGKERLMQEDPSIDGPSDDVERVLDLRDLSIEEVEAYFASAPGNSNWRQYQFTPAQMKSEAARGIPHEALRVTVPDFLKQSRLLSTGRYGDVLKEIGVRGTIQASRVAAPMLMRERSLNFWVAAMGLLAAALNALPRDFQGTILLHGQLTDIALSLRRLNRLEEMLALCRRKRPRARIGFHTNLPVEALNALQSLSELVDEVSVLSSPRALGVSELFASMRRAYPARKLTLTAEVGLAPEVVHRVAFHAPESWTHGANALLIGIGAEAVLAEMRRERFYHEWSAAFPGLRPPHGTI